MDASRQETDAFEPVRRSLQVRGDAENKTGPRFDAGARGGEGVVSVGQSEPRLPRAVSTPTMTGIGGVHRKRMARFILILRPTILLSRKRTRGSSIVFEQRQRSASRYALRGRYTIVVRVQLGAAELAAANRHWATSRNTA